MNWWTSLGPEVTKALLMFLFGGGLTALWKARQADRKQRIDANMAGNSQLVQLTEKLQSLSGAAVDQAMKDVAGMRAEITALRAKVTVLERHERACSDWHVDHMENFDSPARRIIERVAPDELPTLILKPYPTLEDATNG